MMKIDRDIKASIFETLVITGSSSLDLADRTQEPLTRRTDTHTLHPISINELSNKTSPMEVDSMIEGFMTYGMYPEIINTATTSKKIKRLKELTTSYLYDQSSYTQINRSNYLPIVLNS